MASLHIVPSEPVSLVEELAWHAGSVCLVVVSPEGLILRANDAAHRTLKPAPGGFVWDMLPASGASVLRVLMQQAKAAPVRRVLLNFSDGESYATTLTCSIGWDGVSYVLFGEVLVESDERMRQELLDLTRHLVESNRACAKVGAELERTLEELRSSHWHIQKIQEFLPACCVCTKVRTDPGDEVSGWRSLAAFLADNGLLMSHGYCPECEAKALAEIETELPLPA